MIKYEGVKGGLYGFESKLYLNPLKALVNKGCYLMYRQIAWGSSYASLSPRRHAVRFTIPENGIYLKLPCLRFRPIPKESLGRSQRKRPRTVYKNVLHWSGHQDEQSAHELERQGRANLN